MNLLKLYSHLFTIIVVICFTASCKKDNIPSPPPPHSVDTLTAGWQKITISEARDLLDVFFVNKNVGWICGGDYVGKSTDGGLTWTRQQVSTETENIFDLFFLDELNGWVISDRSLYKTRNGGASWQKIAVSGSGIYGDLQFLNPRLGYMTSEMGLHRSIDSGLTWTKVPGNFVPGKSLHFTDSLKGWVTGSSKPAYTADGGTTFTVSHSFAGVNQRIVQFADASAGWIAGAGGVWHTSDAGANWTKVVNTVKGGDIHFINKNDGYICADNRIYKTTNGGQTINLVAYVAHREGLVEIHFTDLNHGWAVSYGNFILRYAQ